MPRLLLHDHFPCGTQRHVELQGLFLLPNAKIPAMGTACPLHSTNCRPQVPNLQEMFNPPKATITPGA